MKSTSSKKGSVLLSAGLVIATALYALLQHADRDDAIVTANTTGAVVTTSAPSSDTAQSSSAPEPSSAPAQPTPEPRVPVPTAPKTQGLYADGAYVGSPADAYYGTVQVKATVSDGKLADVQFLQYPNDRSTSRLINSQAMPILTRQALEVQGSNVDGVSGASETTQAFRQSLHSALIQAQH